MQGNQEKLERFIDSALRQLPLLRAPSSLEASVLAQIAKQAAQPWWRQNFLHWPLAARGVFILVSAGFIKLAVMGVTWIFGAAAAPAASVRSTARVASSLGEVGVLLFNSIPTQWLYLGVALGAGLYLVLFGLGATAYRTLYK